ncbi:MAG: MFS transporter [Oscillospiraceae bacterium]|nr:MFS transporter [Oscillospiraceae bacterium]
MCFLIKAHNKTYYRTDEKIKTSTKWFFSLGDIFSGGFFNIVNFFYAFFLTNVVGISPFWAGAVFLVGNLLDALTDPGMGIITDNTRTKFGRRRPYIILGAPLVLLAFVMMWFPLSGGTEISRVVFYMFAFVLMNTVTTIVQVPYLSMAAELTTDYNERTSLTNVRMLVSVTSSIICAVVPMLIVGAYQDVRTGYIVMSVIFGLFFTLPLILVFLKVKERKQFSQGRKATFADMFKPLRLRIFRRFMYIYLGAILAMDIIAMIFAYYMTYSLNRFDEISFVLGTLLVSQVLCVPLASWFAKRTSKITAIIVGNVGWAICAAASFLITSSSPWFSIYILASVLGIFIGFTLIGYNSLFGDVTEIGEYYLGYRAEGSFYGIQQFVRKCCSAVANWFALFLLGITGFVSPIEVVENGIVELVSQPQTPLVLFTINGILGIVSIILLIPSTIHAVIWKLTKENHAKLIAYLDRKRSGLEVSAEEEQEVKEICEPLI